MHTTGLETVIAGRYPSAPEHLMKQLENPSVSDSGSVSRLNLYQSVTDRIIRSLESQVVPWRRPWDIEYALPINAQSEKPYRGINVFLLSLANYRDHRWMTFRQVRDRGGRVRLGEKATMVVFWKRWSPHEAETEEDQSRKGIPILRHFHVFNAEQCEALDLPELPRRSQHRHERLDRAEEAIRSMPDPPQIHRQGTSAWYRPATDLVQVPPLESFRSRDTFYATLFHELAHATGHEKRLARPAVTSGIEFGSRDYSREELVAELTAAFCCASIGIDDSVINDAASYLQGWLSVLRADSRAIVSAAAQAQRAADYILRV